MNLLNLLSFCLAHERVLGLVRGILKSISAYQQNILKTIFLYLLSHKMHREPDVDVHYRDVKIAPNMVHCAKKDLMLNIVETRVYF